MPNESKKPLFLFVFRAPQNQPDPTPDEMQKIFGRWMDWVKNLKDQGRYLGGDPLEETGKVLRGPRGKSVTDGPFVESKEIVGGYMVVSADSIEQATTIAKDCPGLDLGGIVEVRPIDSIPGM
ncbi:MAG: YCII-related domain protein [Verrucomicrobia bacterium]|nr:YCII-related domain protein [Verrucomicrobiota bacterium]